jgi:hypothetical protein
LIEKGAKMDKIVVCKLTVQRADKPNLSCFVKMTSITPIGGMWERYAGELTLPNFHTQGTWFLLPHNELSFCYLVPTKDPITKTALPLFNLKKVDFNFWEKITPQQSLIGEGYILPVERCEWMLGFALPNNLPH